MAVNTHNYLSTLSKRLEIDKPNGPRVPLPLVIFLVVASVMIISFGLLIFCHLRRVKRHRRSRAEGNDDSSSGESQVKMGWMGNGLLSSSDDRHAPPDYEESSGDGGGGFSSSGCATSSGGGGTTSSSSD